MHRRVPCASVPKCASNGENSLTRPGTKLGSQRMGSRSFHPHLAPAIGHSCPDNAKGECGTKRGMTGWGRRRWHAGDKGADRTDRDRMAHVTVGAAGRRWRAPTSARNGRPSARTRRRARPHTADTRGRGFTRAFYTHSIRRAPLRSWTRSRVHWGWCPSSGPRCASFRCLDPPTPFCKWLRLSRCLSGACPGVRSCVIPGDRRLQTAGQAAHGCRPDPHPQTAPTVFASDAQMSAPNSNLPNSQLCFIFTGTNPNKFGTVFSTISLKRTVRMVFDDLACEYSFPNKEISCSEIGSPEVCQSQPFEVIKEHGKDLSKP